MLTGVLRQESRRLPDWGKIEFYEYPGQSWDDILKGASSNGRDLVSHLVKYESSERYSATEVREFILFVVLLD